MTSDADDVSPESDLSAELEDDVDDTMAERQKETAESNGSSDNHASSSNGQKKTASNAKDPQRPRRKKARRACYACQRAHLTCGDERPCQRCIKRGLQDACQDGVRKKAKYLHDAPPEALIPPGATGGAYLHLNGTKNSSTSHTGLPMTGTSIAQTSPSYFAQNQPTTLDLYAHGNGQSPLPPHMQNNATNASFGSSQTSLSPGFNGPGGRQNSQMTDNQTGLPQSSQAMAQFGDAIFDPSDPALFNLDIASLNFGNHYGALEFGMLGHMSSSANDVNGGDMMNPMGHIQNAFSTNYTDSSPLLFGGGPDALINADWTNQQRQTSSSTIKTPHNTPISTGLDASSAPHAYTIGAKTTSLASASPISISQDISSTAENSASSPAMFSSGGQSHSPIYNRQHQPVQQPQTSSTTTDVLAAQTSYSNPLNLSRKRPYDADLIYETVKKPYPYTSGFHRLLNFIKTRFSKDRIIRIAQALSAVRPSLITFAEGLTESDLVFMEVGVQRKLFAYSDFINAYGTPTIITRRDGAIVAASQEFAILTGWSKAVLLGKEPNQNINTGGATGTNTAATSGRGTRRPSVEAEAVNPGAMMASNGTLGPAPPSISPIPSQPVLIAEIMDQDSVVQFYEDYAKLAFGDPMGTAFRRGKLLKYRTKESMLSLAAGADDTVNEDAKTDFSKMKSEPSNSSSGKQDVTSHRDLGINRLGEKEGMVDCMYCWNVRRDSFEVPMLIVMNFLPVI